RCFGPCWPTLVRSRSRSSAKSTRSVRSSWPASPNFARSRPVCRGNSLQQLAAPPRPTATTKPT
ncbi:hypothetical protein CH063_12415, partial [Colletotrichum higginsianum]